MTYSDSLFEHHRFIVFFFVSFTYGFHYASTVFEKFYIPVIPNFLIFVIFPLLFDFLAFLISGILHLCYSIEVELILLLLTLTTIIVLMISIFELIENSRRRMAYAHKFIDYFFCFYVLLL